MPSPHVAYDCEYFDVYHDNGSHPTCTPAAWPIRNKISCQLRPTDWPRSQSRALEAGWKQLHLRNLESINIPWRGAEVLSWYPWPLESARPEPLGVCHSYHDPTSPQTSWQLCAPKLVRHVIHVDCARSAVSQTATHQPRKTVQMALHTIRSMVRRQSPVVVKTLVADAAGDFSCNAHSRCLLDEEAPRALERSGQTR
jgi:hypothetical protein